MVLMETEPAVELLPPSEKSEIPLAPTKEKQQPIAYCHGETDIRSLAMSVNIANSVFQEVNHLIRVSRDFSNDFRIPDNSYFLSQSAAENISLDADTMCSFTLPTGSIIAAVVLSKWNDIIGPQTVHVWLQKATDCENKPRGIKQCSNNISATLLKSIHYVTCHTVNCASVSFPNSSSIMLSVPDLNMVSIAQLFLSPRLSAITVPFSIAIIANYNHCSFLQQRFGVLQNWINKLPRHLVPILLEEVHGSGVELTNDVTVLILELNEAISSFNTFALDRVSYFSTEKLINLLSYSALPQAVTSHLQTFGCTSVIGSKYQHVNKVITFLSLFLDEVEKCSSMYVPALGHVCFRSGLYLQGILLEAFGYREMSSSNIISNKYPVTIIDLTRSVEDGGVKQSPLYHFHLAFQQTATNQTKESFDGDSVSKSLLHTVKDSSKLVSSLLAELAVLPVSNWKQHIKYFKLTILHFAQLFFSFIRGSENLLCNKTSNTSIQQFKKCLKLGDADFLIILAECEKLKPGFFSYVMDDPKI